MSILTHSSVKINMKYIRVVAILLILIIVIDGFSGEFSNPTAFDIIKWICCIILAGCLLFSKKK